MASITIHRQPLARGPGGADNRLSDPIGTNPHPSPKDHADLPIGDVRDIDASNDALARERIEARVTAVLTEVETIRSYTRDVYFSASDGVVILYGAVRDSAAAREIEQSVRGITGVDLVVNKIRTIGPHTGD
jgi:hypothetical protein